MSIFELSPPPRDTLLITRLRHAKTYPISLTKTKRFCSFMNYALTNYDCHVFLYTAYMRVLCFTCLLVHVISAVLSVFLMCFNLVYRLGICYKRSINVQLVFCIALFCRFCVYIKFNQSINQIRIYSVAKITGVIKIVWTTQFLQCRGQQVGTQLPRSFRDATPTLGRFQRRLKTLLFHSAHGRDLTAHS